MIERVQELLKSHDGPKSRYRALELLREPLLKERCRLQKEFYQAREKLRVPKDKELTDFDRTIMNNAYCAEVQEQYEYVKGLEELVKERLEYYRANH